MPDAAVIGGGLGGLAAAIALERAGYEVTVFEQAEAARHEGGSISLWSNGTAALAALGVLPTRAQVIRRMVLKDSVGRDLLDLDVAAVSARYGYESINVWRHDLIADLTHAFGGDIRFGKRCIGLVQERGSVTARFSDGATAAADLLVGADGVHSAVRSALWGGRATYAGTTCWEGQVPRGPGKFADQTVLAVATASTYSMAFPMPDDRVHWFVDTRRPSPTAPGPDKSTLEAICDKWPLPFPALVRSTGEGDLYQVPIYVRRPPRRWYRGVAVLLGDAAHGMGPALGQGGAQAFVDAVALRRSLERVIDIEDALRDYQRQRAGAILRLWVGSNITLRMRRTGLLELATRLTPARLAHRSFARSVAPDRQVLENLSPADPGP